jgi:class 3 adenylate cyclase
MGEGGQRVSRSAGAVALLFTDLVGPTEVLDRLGDEAAEELRRTHFSLLRRAVTESGGTEVKRLGDGLMVAFTSPVSALECAVKMQEAVAEHNRDRPGQTLQVRVGVHAGEPLQDADDYHGSAVVVAKGLCDQARGGQILASEIVAALVGRRGQFRLRSLGRLELKGLAEPMPALAVDWCAGPSPSSAPLPPAPLPRRALVGRDEELARIQSQLYEADRGQVLIVFLVGDMCMGKTSLAEEALARARDGGFLVLVGRTPSAGSGLAYAPLLSAFGCVLRAVEPVRRDILVGDLLHLGRHWPELGLPPPAPLQDPELERALLFEAVARLVERLAAETPLALFIDDLHWADASSLALLGYLTPGLVRLPVLLLGAYRPEGVAESRGLRHRVTNGTRPSPSSPRRRCPRTPPRSSASTPGIRPSCPDRPSWWAC